MYKVFPDVCKSPHNHYKQMDNSHTLIGRRNKSTRYYWDNCDALCKGCHRKVEESALLAYDFKYKQIGSDGMKRLIKKRNTITKRTIKDKKELLDEIQKELDLERELDINYGE